MWTVLQLTKARRMQDVIKNKWQKWRESQDPKVIAYLDNQPTWRDTDLYKAVVVGIIIGIVVGFAWGYAAGLPDYSNMPIRYLKG